MMTRTEGIAKMLRLKALPDLAALYTQAMECQVLVARDGGTREGDYQGWRGCTWTDGSSRWYPIRIPKDAGTEPVDNSLDPLTYDIVAHAEGIGMTGWDWKNRCSKWVAFDFDAITGHSDKHAKKLSDEEMSAVRKMAEDIEWVTTRRSASGRGLHLYVFLNDFPTANHHEHAALARSILSMMSALARFDFINKVDVCGGNMWVWHRKMTKENRGFELLKQGTVLDSIPPNWKDHVKVVTGQRRKIAPMFIEEKNADLFDELTGQRPHIKLDDEHKKLLDWLRDNNCVAWWDTDHHMLVTHTIHLAEAHVALDLKGVFKTASKGDDKGNDHNCLSGETEVLTEQGVRTLRELAKTGSASLRVRTAYGDEWQTVEVRSFGTQVTYPVLLGTGNHIRATRDHRWVVDGKSLAETKFTSELTQRTYLPLMPLRLPDVDRIGYAHGFVFGDGWVRNTRGKLTSEVALFGQDTDLCPLLSKFGTVGDQKYGMHRRTVVRQLPVKWKELPRNPTREYALGFVLGLISADGFVEDQLQISCSDWADILEVRKLAIFAGFRCRPIQIIPRNTARGYKTSKTESYKLFMSTYNVNASMFLRADHKEKLVVTKSYTTSAKAVLWDEPREEEVFCAVVPDWHNFTLADGTITGNCFVYPLRRGAWSVRRYTPGCAEDQTWTQDGVGWTYCYYNKEPDLATASRHLGAVENEKSGWVFQEAAIALKAARILGANIDDLPSPLMGRPTVLKQHKDGNRIVMELDHNPNDRADEMRGWLAEKGKWKRVVSIAYNPGISETDVGNYDDLMRHVVSESGEDAGWTIKADAGWHMEPLVHAKAALKANGTNAKDIDLVVGSSVCKPWVLCNRPFEPEYPGDRLWNRRSAQLRISPADTDGPFDHWRKILKHCGAGLNDALKFNAWAQVNSINDGSEYLMLWIASLIQFPKEPLPYLFLYGPDQNSGKSIFHESMDLLISRGITRAGHALKAKGDFNAELENAVLCVIEEIDIAGASPKEVYNKIKDWVTSPKISIHRKNYTPYDSPNTTHWIQVANDHESCPIFTGDTRITMAYVGKLDPLDLIPKKELMSRLRQEAPYFLRHVLSLELPPSNDRLNIPIIETEQKKQAGKANQTLLEKFISEKCYHVAGAAIPFKEFWEKFQDYLLDEQDKIFWSKIKTSKSLPPEYPSGTPHGCNNKHIGNISWTPFKPGDIPSPMLVLRGDALVPTKE